MREQDIWRSNKKEISKNTLIGAAEVSFYNHGCLKAFNGKFIEICFKLFKYLVGVLVCQKFDETWKNIFQGKLAFRKFTGVKCGNNDSLRHLVEKVFLCQIFRICKPLLKY